MNEGTVERISEGTAELMGYRKRLLLKKQKRARIPLSRWTI